MSYVYSNFFLFHLFLGALSDNKGFGQSIVSHFLAVGVSLTLTNQKTGLVLGITFAVIQGCFFILDAVLWYFQKQLTKCIFSQK